MTKLWAKDATNHAAGCNYYLRALTRGW